MTRNGASVLGVVVGCLIAAAPASAQIRLSVSTAGDQANGDSVQPAISGDGRFVVFASLASNLVPGDTNGVADVFLRDRDTDADGIFDEAGAVATTRLSVGPGGVQSNGISLQPAITPDGRYVAFTSTATNLVPGLSGDTSQVFRLDRTTGAITLISATNVGTPASRSAVSPSISDDGEWVAFQSDATNLSLFASSGRSAIYMKFVPQLILLHVSPSDNVAHPTAYVEPTVIGAGARVAYRAILAAPQPALSWPEVYERDGQFNRRAADGEDWIYSQASASGRHVIGQTSTQVRRNAIDLLAPAGVELGAIGGVLAGVSPSGRYAYGAASVIDLDFRDLRPLRMAAFEAAYDRQDRWLVLSSQDLPGGGGQAHFDIWAVDLPDVLDADNDGIDDGWEARFQVDNPAADPDGDGLPTRRSSPRDRIPTGRSAGSWPRVRPARSSTPRSSSRIRTPRRRRSCSRSTGATGPARTT